MSGVKIRGRDNSLDWCYGSFSAQPKGESPISQTRWAFSEGRAYVSWSGCLGIIDGSRRARGNGEELARGGGEVCAVGGQLQVFVIRRGFGALR